MRTVLFINAHSRQAAHNVEAVREFFARADCPFEVLDFIVVEKLDDFPAYLERLKGHKNAECVIVGSGDGTIVTVLNALKGRDLVYGFLPLGTSNDFVWSLGLPADFRKTLKVLSAQHVRSITLGSVNDVLFANVAGIGLATNVVKKVSNRLKRYLGPLAYVVSIFYELRRHEAVWFEVTADGKTISFYTHSLLIVNGKYHGHIRVHDSASLYKHNLMIAAVTGQGRLSWLRGLFRLALRRPKREMHKNALAFPVEQARIVTRPVRDIQADGELVGKTPAQFKVIKDAVRVLTPPEVPPKLPGIRRKNRR